jgi:ferredoxin
MRKPPYFMSVSRWLKPSDHPVKSGPNARKAVIIPLLIGQYGSMKQKFESMKTSGNYLRSSMKNLMISAKGVSVNPHTGKRKIDEKTLQELEEFILSLGISKIGFAKVNPDNIFDGFEILCDTALVLALEMDRELVKTSPSIVFAEEIYRTYDELGIAVNKVADWLRERGYDCHASPAVGGDVNLVPVAQNAGIGCIGKNGILVTPEFGPCVRLAAVFIDVENLPISTDNEHLWIRDFCETCNRCIKTCPVGAIHQQPKILADGTERFIDLEKCAVPFSEGCSTCIKDCVFTPGNYEKIKTSFQKKITPQNTRKNDA